LPVFYIVGVEMLYQPPPLKTPRPSDLGMKAAFFLERGGWGIRAVAKSGIKSEERE